MGPENKIEFTGGTLYFAPVDRPDETVAITGPIEWIGIDLSETEDFTAGPIDIPTIKTLESMEFEGTCKITFRGLVLLIGFWPAVKLTVRGWWNKFRRLFNGRKRSENPT